MPYQTEIVSDKKELERISRRVIDSILSGNIKNAADLRKLKMRISRESKYKGILSNSQILSFAKEEEKKSLSVLKKKPVRTISGVAVVAVMCKPHECPGRCIYCPSIKNVPRSYTGREPAAIRADMFGFDPYRQASHRLKQLGIIGHETSKVELIIMGGTFSSLDAEYQRHFVKRCFDALNGADSETLEDAQKLNETAQSRCVGLTIETRPDYVSRENVDLFLELGATRVELGVQTISDEVYKKINRGHTLKDVIKATALLKDAGYKVCYHYMPGLFADESEDVLRFESMFLESSFRPDMLKVYPVLIIEGTKLYDMWKKKQYAPYDNKTAAKVIARMLSKVPDYVRVMRVQRDIPAQKISCGVTASNLYELVEAEMKRGRKPCRCIRCREAGHRGASAGDRVQINVEKYAASGGTEYFISADSLTASKKDNIKALFGYLRLRFPENPQRLEITKKTAIVRELKVVGSMAKIGEKDKEHIQHSGIGKILMDRAEKISREKNMEKIAVISAVGTREYYRMLGYERDGAYMSKRLS